MGIDVRMSHNRFQNYNVKRVLFHSLIVDDDIMHGVTQLASYFFCMLVILCTKRS